MTELDFGWRLFVALCAFGIFVVGSSVKGDWKAALPLIAIAWTLSAALVLVAASGRVPW